MKDMSLIAKARLYAWSTARVWQHGRPDVSLGFLGGIGDDLLCTAPIDEWLKRGAKRVWFFTRHPELYSHYDQRVQLIPDDPRYQRIAQRLGAPMRALGYSTHDAATDRDTPLEEHLVTAVCRRAGLSGKIALRPRLTLSAAEEIQAAEWADCVAVQASGMTALIPMRNKQWRVDRMQEVVDHLRQRNRRVVQIGSASDPALRGVIDRRGRTGLRQSAALLGQARLFIGLAGFLMHLARAVDCPSVIVYGGREPPELTGYSCNGNVAHRPACAPCWQRNRCDFQHVCMESINTSEVIAEVDKRLALPRAALDTAEAHL